MSKGKSTVCAIKPYGEVLMTPRDFKHTKDDLDSLVKQLSRYKEEIHIIMEATGNYHLPVYQYLKSKDYLISIINPLEMKRYRCQGIRNPKTDKIDSYIIAQYGIDYWYRFKPNDDMKKDGRNLDCWESSIQVICVFERSDVRISATSWTARCPVFMAY